MLINAVCSLQVGVADGEGFLSIWQVNQTTSNPKPYLVSKQNFFIVIIIVEESQVFETWGRPRAYNFTETYLILLLFNWHTSSKQLQGFNDTSLENYLHNNHKLQCNYKCYFNITLV